MFKRFPLIAAVLLVLVSSSTQVFAQEKPTSTAKPVFKNEKANQAVAKHTQALKEADERYTAETGKAAAAMTAALAEAKRAMVKAGNQSEAAAIQSILDDPGKATATALKSNPAKATVAKYAAAVRTAEQQRYVALGLAESELVVGLEEGKIAATKEGDPAEANAINALIDQHKSPFDYGDARKIIFVCGANGTMIEHQKALMQELTAAIAALKPFQAYNVLFFTDGGKYHIADKNGMIVPTGDNKHKTYQFLANVAPIGTTDPVPAVQAAFKLKPQAIYFLSNAHFLNIRSHTEVIDAFKKANVGNKVKVHTVYFETEDAESEESMKTIAAQSGGSYRRVKKVKDEGKD